ncbi:SIMPL domain-containing protein [Nocardia sp. NPDC052254]|uniref:SIMPL domain-containing protein n=1 Tax=Nocardia sp. NPDC052254 TaxID=3155681 RepID=UPI003427B82A
MSTEQPRPANTAAPRPGTVTTFGHGSASATPDRMQVSISVETRAQSVALAYGRAGERTAAVTGALRADGVAAADIATTGLSVRTETTWIENEGNRITGYVATTSLTIGLRIPAASGAAADPAAIIARAVAAGGDDVRLGGLNLTVADQAELLIRAREAAWDDALDRARRYAARAQRDLGPVLEITENTAAAPEPRGEIRFMAARAVDTPVGVEYGEQQVGADLRVTWQLD